MSSASTDDHRALLHEELAELDDQVAAGDIDAATAAKLRQRYETELAALDDVTVTDNEPATDTAAPGRISGRALLGSAVVGIVIVAIGVFAVVSLNEGGTAGAEGVVSDVIEGTGEVDLSEVSNDEMEQVVAQNPDVIGMRLALARRYFEQGDFDKALDHYFEVLDREHHPEALANIGWMTYLSGRPDVAVGYLEKSLERQPDYLPAQWFVSNVYVTLERPDEAVAYLVGLARSSDVPDEIRQGAVTLLEQIEADA